MPAEPVGRFATSDQTILSGTGALAGLAEAVEANGWRRLLLLASPTAAATAGFGWLTDLLGDRVVAVDTAIRGHAPIADTEQLRDTHAGAGVDAVVAYGGGSVSDTAKGLAILFAEGGGLADHCSVFVPPDKLTHRELVEPKVPVLSVPTTLSAAEVTPGGGATDAAGVKRVFWDPKVASRIVCLAPDVLAQVPTEVITTTGMNALAHCAEGLYSRTGTPMSESLARESTRLLADGLAHVTEVAPADRDPEVLIRLQVGAAMSGAVITNARVCLHHAVCHVLGARLGVPHGVANSVMLPHVLRFNLPGTGRAQQAFAESLAAGLRGHPTFTEAAAAVADPPEITARFLARLGVPTRLRDVGVRAEQLREVAAGVMQDRGLYFNPRRIEHEDTVAGVLAPAW